MSAHEIAGLRMLLVFLAAGGVFLAAADALELRGWARSMVRASAAMAFVVVLALVGAVLP